MSCQFLVQEPVPLIEIREQAQSRDNRKEAAFACQLLSACSERCG